MKTLIRKEFRENAKWASLILLALALWMCYAHGQTDAQEGLVAESFHTVTLLGFSAAAFTLGMLLIRQDHRRGRWGFVLHRPITLSQLFLAKLFVGAVVYSLATAIPLSYAAIWFATPGHLAAPFDWHMFLPRLADWIGGFMWLATGLLVASRHARWIGSRLMPIGLGFIIALFATELAPNLTTSALLYAVGIAVMLPAAWGSFLAGEARPPFIIRLLQGAAIAPGISLAVAIAFTLAINFTYSTDFSTEREPYYDVFADGQIVLDSYTPSGAAVITDLRGKPIERPAGTPGTNPQMIVLSPSSSLARPTWQDRLLQFQNFTAYMRPLAGNESAQWYYVVSRRTIEGFARGPRNRFVGSIGPDGFVPPEQTPEPFPGYLFNIYSNQGLQVCETAAYRTHIEGYDVHSASRIFSAAPDDPILNAREVFSDRGLLTVIITASKIHFLQDESERFALPLEHHDPDYQLELYSLADGKVILRYRGNYAPPKPTPPDWIVKADATGHITDRFQLPVLPKPAPRSDPWWVNSAEALICPPALAAGAAIWREIQTPDYVIQSPSDVSAFIAAICGGLIAAALAVLVLRPYSTSVGTFAAWIFICLFLGLPGLLVLRSMRDWPPRVHCANCGKKRLITRELCEHCSAPFAKPADQGIEIFEMA